MSDSLHKLGTNIRKRLHGQLMVTDAEETDGVTFDIYNRVAQESLIITDGIKSKVG